MAYVFETQQVSSLKFQGANSASNLNISNISGTLTSAQTVINGVMALLYIGGLDQDYEPTDAVRTVKQNVDDN